MAKKQSQKPTGLPEDAVDGNVDKIRDILFGGQMRDYEQRFADLEKRLIKSIELMSGTFEKRLDRLNAYSKREIDKLNEKIKDERKARREDVKNGSQDRKEIVTQVETWVAELEEHIAGETQSLRGLLQEQGDELSSVIHETHEKLSRNLANETQTLSDAKLARVDMAELLIEVALRLKKDFELPDA